MATVKNDTLKQTVTTTQMLRLAETFGVTAKISGFRQGYALAALQVAHSIPSTHKQAMRNAKVLIETLGKVKNYEFSGTPKCHFGLVGGGIGGFKAAYDPKRFAARTNYPNTMWACEAHFTSFAKCNANCKQGVALADSTAKKIQFYIGTVSKAKPKPVKPVAQANPDVAPSTQVRLDKIALAQGGNGDNESEVKTSD